MPDHGSSLNRFGMRFHHLGLAVSAPTDASCYLEALGYLKVTSDIFDPLQGVNLAMYSHHEMPNVEVIWPGTAPSVIDRFIKRGRGQVYHLCYTSRNVKASIATMEASGLRVFEISPATPAVLFGGAPVSFFDIVNVGLIELIGAQPSQDG